MLTFSFTCNLCKFFDSFQFLYLHQGCHTLILHRIYHDIFKFLKSKKNLKYILQPVKKIRIVYIFLKNIKKNFK